MSSATAASNIVDNDISMHGPLHSGFIPPSYGYFSSQQLYPQHVRPVSTSCYEDSSFAKDIAELKEQVERLTRLVAKSVDSHGYNKDYSHTRPHSVRYDDGSRTRHRMREGHESSWKSHRYENRSDHRYIRYRSPSPSPRKFRSRDITPDSGRVKFKRDVANDVGRSSAKESVV